MSLVLCVELPEGRLQLVFEVRGLRVLDLDAGVEAEGLVFRDDLHCFQLSLLLPRALPGVGEDLLEHVVLLLLDDGKRLLVACRGGLLEVAHQEVLLVLLQ